MHTPSFYYSLFFLPISVPLFAFSVFGVTEVEEEPSHAKQSYCDVASRPICDAIWTMLFSEGLRHNSARRRQCQFVDHRS